MPINAIMPAYRKASVNAVRSSVSERHSSNQLSAITIKPPNNMITAMPQPAKAILLAAVRHPPHTKHLLKVLTE